jgi:fumarylacetoacetase
MSTPEPLAASWIPVPAGSDFGPANLPYGTVHPRAGGPSRVVVRIGDHVVDLDAAQRAGLLPPELPDGVFAGTLNAFMATGRHTWQATRQRLLDLLTDEAPRRSEVETCLLALDDVEVQLPFEVADYVDFYSSEHHARNMGLIFRPDAEPLLPNWKHLPVGYHGRSATVVVSGEPVPRPVGLTAAPGEVPARRPSRLLDIELELGAVVGTGNERGTRIAVDDAADHVFGFVLLNDWSARDLQAYEYVPLGPFLGKSFATTISPWVVTLDALRPFLASGPVQDPEPSPYLRGHGTWGLDLHLEVSLATPSMRGEGEELVVCRTRFRDMYWTFAQQLAHLTGNGASARTGDLYGSGTVSGPEPGSYGSFMELTWRGRDPFTLPTGETRTFLEDGDTVTLSGWAGDGATRVGFGPCTGTILPPMTD